MTDAPSPEGMPDRIACYRLETPLGRGGMGEVYRGWDERLERPVALKRILLEEAGDPQRSRERFRREARSVARVSHSAIVQIYDWIEGEADDWIVMELVDGESLRDLLAGGPLPPAQVAKIGRQLAAGLAAAHRAGLVHRDLKAENVMLTSAGEVRILDFGLAKRISKEDGIPLSTKISKTGEVVGTVTAMSPEQALGQPVDSRSDLFSLGSLLYYLLTGVLPFSGETSVEVLTRICTVKAVALRKLDPSIPEELEGVVERLLEKDPAHRPESAAAVAEALEAVAAGFSSSAWDRRSLVAEPEAAAALRRRSETAETRIGEDSLVASGLLGPSGRPATPDPAAGESGTRVRTLLLNDLVDSTALVEKLGDERAARVFERHDRAARSLLERHRGREIDKSDGFLMLFERPIDAVRFALGYHAALGEISESEGVAVASRVGIHVGEVVLRANTALDVSRGAKPLEVEGLAKAMAARFMSLAGAGQTLISRGIHDLARRSAVGAEDLPEELRWVEHGRYRMQGVEEPVEVFEVGVQGVAPLKAPADTGKVSRVREVSGRLSGWRLRAAAVAAVVLVGLAALGARQLWRMRQAPATYVVVPETVLKTGGGDPDVRLRLKASAIHNGLLRALLTYRGVAAIEPSAGVVADGGDPIALARAYGAQEVLASELECAGEICQILLRRFDGATGAVRWNRRFTEPDETLLDLSLLTAEQLRAGYSSYSLRPGIADLEVRPADYEAYLRVRRDYELRTDQARRPEIVARLEEILETSPKFLEIYTYASEILIAEFVETRRAEVLEEATALAEQALDLAPQDPRSLRRSAEVYRASGEIEKIADVLAVLEDIEPGTAELLVLKAWLLEKRNQPQEALALMEKAVRQHPSWQLYNNLADLSRRTGDLEASRGYLELLLERAPRNYDVISRLAQLEMIGGSMERSVELYEQLVEISPEGTELTNLGVAYLLMERYDAAAFALERALRTSEGSPPMLLNLADAENLRGNAGRARDLYQRVLVQVDEVPNPDSLLTLRAQALAQLGRAEEAVAAVQEALRLAPDNPSIAYEAALVYALVGERNSAIAQARRALDAGVERRWFDFAWFDPVRDRLFEE